MSTEYVLASGKLIKQGELFWPEEAAFHVLADSWVIVDPLESDDDSISQLVTNPLTYDIARKAEQDLVQIGFAPQSGGWLELALIDCGAEALFKEDLWVLIQTPKVQAEKGGEFVAILAYDVNVGEKLEKQLTDYLNLETATFQAAKGLLLEIDPP